MLFLISEVSLYALREFGAEDLDELLGLGVLWPALQRLVHVVETLLFQSSAFHTETLIIYKLESMEFTTQNDLY